MAETPDYIDLPLPTSSGEYMDIAEEVMTDNFEDWDRNTASADVAILEADSEIAADLSEAATTVATNIYVDSGQRLDGLLPVEPVAATGVTTWTAYDASGPYEIPPGSTVGIDIGGGQLVTFQTVEDTEVPNGSTTVAGVAVIASEPGEVGNGLTGASVIVDAPSTIASVAFTDTTGGGAEGETVEEYLARLVIFRLLRSASPVVARDFPRFAQAEIAGIERATYLDGYHPVDVPAESYVVASYSPTNMATWRDKTVTVVGQDADGEPLATADFTAAGVLFNGDAATGVPGHREAGFVVNVLNPHYTPVAVSATVTAWEGWDPTQVKATAEGALESFLDPSSWGQPSGDQRGWENTPVLRGSDLYSVLKSVEGVKAITALTFGQGAISDDFSTDTIASGLWTVVLGSLTITGGHLAPSAVTAYALYRSVLYGDMAITRKITTGASVAGGTWSLSMRLDDNNRISARIDNTALTIRKSDAGVDSQLATTATVIGAAQTRWLRMVKQGNVVTAELWSTDPALGGTPAGTVSHTLAGANATKYGAGVFLYPSMRGSPVGTDEVYDDFTAAGIMGTSDLTLVTTPTEPVPLPRPSTMTVTVA